MKIYKKMSLKSLLYLWIIFIISLEINILKIFKIERLTKLVLCIANMLSIKDVITKYVLKIFNFK